MIRRIVVLTYWLLPLAGSAALIPSSDGTVVYDSATNVSWLADANLPATNRFGVALCNGAGPQPCIYASGLMQYRGAQAWVAAMNASNYLGRSDWQIPTTPASDSGCGKTGPNGNSFGFNCGLGALGSLYYTALGLKAPNTAVSIPPNVVGPFISFQPYLYWSQMFAGQNTGYATFSFASGFQGANTAPNFLYVLPMFPGKISGAPPSSGIGLEVNPGEQTIYDPVANVTWLANANLAATNTFGLPRCSSPINPAICVNQDGAMTWDTASQFIANMNTTSGTGYLGQTHWQLAPMDQSCTGYNCASSGDPLAELFYQQLKFSQGTPVASTPAIGVGPFKNFQPYLYWTCEAATIQSACQTDGPSPNFEFSFSFGNGFLGTDLLANDLYATAYFVGPPTNSGGGEVPRFSASGITNAASFASGSLVAGSIATIFGTNLTSGTGINIASGLPLPMHFLNVTVNVNGVPAPIFAVDNVAGQQQINFQTPWEVEGLSIAPVSVTNNGVTSATIQVPVLHTQPGIFAYDTGGSSFGAILHANFQLADTAHPATGGETVLIYCTGLGPVLPAQQSGSPATGLAPTITAPTVTIGGVIAPTSYSGLAPGFVGLYQINAMVPSGLGTGNKSVVITTGTVASKPALLPVQ